MYPREDDFLLDCISFVLPFFIPFPRELSKRFGNAADSCLVISSDTFFVVRYSVLNISSLQQVGD